MKVGRSHLLTCLLLAWTACCKANWLNFDQGILEGKKQLFLSPRPDSDESYSYVSNDVDATEDASFARRSDDDPDDFDALREDLRLPDNQLNILREFSDSPSKVVPDAARYISEFVRQEMDEIEDVALPLSNLLPFNGTLIESDRQDLVDENLDGSDFKESKDIGNDGSGEFDYTKDESTEETPSNNETSVDVNDNEEQNQKKKDPRFKHQGKNVKHNDNDNRPTKKYKKTKGIYSSIAKIKIEGENDYSVEGHNEDDLDLPVIFGKERNQYRKKPAKSDTGSSGDLQELGNLVVKSKTMKYDEANKTVDEFRIKKDNVSKARSDFQTQYNAKLDVYFSSPSTPRNTKSDKQEWNKKSKINLDKGQNGLRSKRSKYSDTRKLHTKSSIDDDNDRNDEDYIRLKKSGIFENIANAFAHIEKIKKEGENKEKRKKTTLKKIHKANANQPVNGGFTQWTEWSECSETCGNDSIKMRMRVCTNPPPANGGKDCQGWRFEVKYCKLPSCQAPKTKKSEGISPKNPKNSSMKIDIESQRKEIEKEGIERYEHEQASNASTAMENTKITEDVKQQRTKTNHIIEKMFKDVIHKAFDRSKALGGNATRPIEIHTDSGIITSENEIDTIDDAPDSSQDMGSEAQENQLSQDMESQGQETQSPQDMETEGDSNDKLNQENQSSKVMESESQETQTQSSQSMELQDQETQSSQVPETENDVKRNQTQEDQASQDTNDKHIQKSQSSQDTNAKQTQKSPSSQEVNAKHAQESKSSQDASAKQTLQESQSSRETSTKQTQESQSSQETKEKQTQESQSSQETRDKQTQESQSSQEASAKQTQESQSSQETKDKQTQESQSSQETRDKQTQESQSSQETSAKQTQESQSSQDISAKQTQESQSSQETHDIQTQESQSSQETSAKQTQESQSSQETKNKQTQGSQSYQETSAKQAQESQSSQDTSAKQIQEGQSSQDMDLDGDRLSKTTQPKNEHGKGDKSNSKVVDINYNSIDGNYDVVVKADENNQHGADDQTVQDITKVATEILKNNDTESVLRALGDKDADILDSYPDIGLSNAKTQETVQKKKSPIKVNISSADENGQGINLASNRHGEKEGSLSHGKDQEHSSLSSNSTAINHKSTDKKQDSNQLGNQTESSGDENKESKNVTSIMKISSHAIKDVNETTSSTNDEKNKTNQEPLKEKEILTEQLKEDNSTAKEGTDRKNSNDQGNRLDVTISKQDERLEIEKDSSGQENASKRKQSDNDATSIDWGNLHALNALVEILAEHEKNATQNNNTQNQSNNGTSKAPTNTTVNNRNTTNGNLSNTGQEAQGDTTKLTSFHDNEKVSFVKDDKENNINNDDYAIHEGGKRQNVTGEGNARSKSNLTMPENPNTGPTDNKKENTDDKSSSSGIAISSITDTKNATTKQDSLFNLIKEVVLNLRSNDNPDEAARLDKPENQTGSKKVNHDNDKNAFKSWTAWTTCSKSCGEGTKTRVRKCLLDQKACKGRLNETVSCYEANCPVDGGFTGWTAWSSCSGTCGEGIFKTRSRSCTNPVARFGGKPCKGDVTQQQDCKLKPCVGFEIAGKVGNETLFPKIETYSGGKGMWGPWSAWSKCTVTCGGKGYSSRERFCLPGKKCTGPRYHTKDCGLAPCPVDGGFTEWTSWSPCTPSCGERAYRMRSRTCTSPLPSHGGKKCVGSTLETQPCNIVGCPIDGGYSPWSSWSRCTKTCNSSSLSRRERECTRPKPKNGGKPCEGKSVEMRECGKQPCPVNGGLSEWSSWTHCANSSCGTSLFTTRVRTCDNPRPQFGGKNCTEALLEKKSCQFKYCPVHGGFSNWSSWSACPKNCKVASVSHRRRRCNNPKSLHGGRGCVGPKIETRICSDICPVDGGFTEWTSWSKCSQECGRTSIKSRERYCTNPKPVNGGKKCKGSRFQISVCKSDYCPGNGNYTEWSSWTACPRCGFGVRTRERTCTNPPPTNGGKDCVGPGKESLACPFRKCRDEGFGQWSPYGHCSKSCGGGAKMRRRTCEDESKGCDGKFIQLKTCNIQSCILGNDHIINTNPVDLCGFNPCEISRCLGNSDAMCLASSSCWPVFFDKRGNILESCNGDKAVLSSSPEAFCHSDPCKVSGCYTDEATSCYVSTRCKPVFLDATGKKLDCTGLLKVPPVSVCGADPCEGRSCDIDNSARCIADYSCNPVFISSENEILSKCRVSKYRDANYIINSKAGKKSSQTNQEMEDAKTQLQAFLKNSGESVGRVETIAEYNSEMPMNPTLTAEQQNELEYKLEHLKKRNRFYRPKTP